MIKLSKSMNRSNFHSLITFEASIFIKRTLY